jgi:hypothetical protein
MDRTSAQPQVNLSLLRSNSLQFQPLLTNNNCYFALQVAAKFMIEDDEEQMKEELKEAFR